MSVPVALESIIIYDAEENLTVDASCKVCALQQTRVNAQGTDKNRILVHGQQNLLWREIMSWIHRTQIGIKENTHNAEVVSKNQTWNVRESRAFRAEQVGGETQHNDEGAEAAGGAEGAGGAGVGRAKENGKGR